VYTQRDDRLTRLQAALEKAREDLVEISVAVERRQSVLAEALSVAGKGKNASLIGDEDPHPGLLSVPEAERLVADSQKRRREVEEVIEALTAEIGPGPGSALALASMAAMRAREALLDVLEDDGALETLAGRLRGPLIDADVAAVFLSLGDHLPQRYRSEAEFARRLAILLRDHGCAFPAEAPLVQHWQAAIAKLQPARLIRFYPCPPMRAGE
jgi:hypothetical protein